MKTYLLAAVLIPFSALAVNAQEAKEATTDVKMKSLTARSLELKIPDAWKEAKPNGKLDARGAIRGSRQAFRW